MVKPVFGVAYCNEKIYVVMEDLNVVQVYSLITNMKPIGLQLDSIIQIPEMKKPQDIVAYSDFKYLLIADRVDKNVSSIWCVTLHELNTVRILESINYPVASLSTRQETGNKYLILTPDAEVSSELRIYSIVCEGPDNLLYTVKLLRHVNQPTHIIMSRPEFEKDYNFFVCNNRIDKPKGGGSVVHIDAESNIVRSVNLDSPNYIVPFDEETMLVADGRNCRVILINCDLTESPDACPSIDLTEVGFGHPTRLAYDQHSGRLVVGFKTGAVCVFSIYNRNSTEQHLIMSDVV